MITIDSTPLSAIQIHISRLNELSASELDKTQMFIIADIIRPGEADYGDGAILLTKKISYDTLSSNLFENLRTDDEVSLNGRFTFDNDKPLHIKTSLVDYFIKKKETNCVINIEYLYNDIIDRIYKLSAELYGKPPEWPYSHVPSVVGDIITSRRLSTLVAVRQTYGNYTDWQRVECFVIGAGSIEINTSSKYGEINQGELNLQVGNKDLNNGFSVKLNTDEIPKHIHGFRANSTSFSITWYLSWINEEINLADHECGVQFYPASAIHRTKHKYDYNNSLWQVKESTIANMHATFTGQGSLSTRNFSATLDWLVVDNDSGKIYESDDQTAHNNMPPFIIEYMWRRIK